MTNLEANKERIMYGMGFCAIAHLCRYGELCTHKICPNCEFNENVDECIKEVLAEHKKPIKLKQWERDLLDCYHSNFMFGSYDALVRMKQKGCFKGITDITMTVKEILDNCEVVER